MSDIDFTRYDANVPIREITYEALKDAIISGSILPGERIVESKFAKQLNISRTPIREALRKLETDGLVEYTPRKGVVVKSLETEDINEIYIIRKTLEELALRFAVENITQLDIDLLYGTLEKINEEVDEGDIHAASKYSRDIHLQIYKISGLKRLVAIISTLDEYMNRFSYMSLSDEQVRRKAAKEHGQIIDSLRRKDLDQLLKLSGEHLEDARVNCIAAYNQKKREMKKNSE